MIKVLVINSGSSSIKYQLFNMDGEAVLASGAVERIGERHGLHKHRIHKGSDLIESRYEQCVTDHRAGLARIGSVDAVDKLLQAADVDPGWERIQATKHCLVLAERLQSGGNEPAARRIYQHLEQTRTDPAESYVRAVAASALAAIGLAIP